MSRTIAHRGGSGISPENTLVAFRRAYSMGVRAMELDVHLDADGRLVVVHDPTVDRTTDGRGAVAALRTDELLSLDAAYHFRDDRGEATHRGRGVRIPTLDEVLEALPDVFFVLELKPRGRAIAEAVRAAVDRHRAFDRVCVASFDEPTLRAFRAQPGPRARTSGGRELIARMLAASRLHAEHRLDWPMEMLQVPPSSDGLRIVDRRFVEACHRVGVEVHVWTIDDRDAIERLLGLGVDAIITDRPDRMADLG